MSSDPVADLDYRAEFERRQFELYEARRLAEETQASAVIAVALVVVGLVLTDYARQIASQSLVPCCCAGRFLMDVRLSTSARIVSWETPRWRGGAKLTETPVPSNRVKSTRVAVREHSGADQQEL